MGVFSRLRRRRDARGLTQVDAHLWLDERFGYFAYEL